MSRILSIVWYKVLPPMFGGQKGIAGFNKELSYHHSLVCLCSKDNVQTGESSYSIIPDLPISKWQFINPFTWNKISRYTKKIGPRFIILEHPYHGIAAVKAAKATGAQLILHAHNIECVRFRDLGKRSWRILKHLEKWTHRKASLCLFKTPSDRDFAIENFEIPPEKCIVIPYGVPKPIINPHAGSLIRARHNINPEEKIFLFAGTLDYEPNAEAIKDIFTQVLPRLEQKQVKFRLLICGRNRESKFDFLKRLHSPLAIIVGEVEDIDNYFQAADVFLNPVKMGGGVQTKNLDALSHHCNLVCFEEMAANLPQELVGRKVQRIKTEDWDGFANAIMIAMEDKIATPEAFFTYFGWGNCIKPLLEKLNQE